MSRTTMPAQVICVLVAFVLVCNLIPANSLAFANSDTSVSQSESVLSEELTDEDTSEASNSTDTSTHLNQDVSIAADTNEKDAKESTDGIEILTTSIDLSNTQTVLSYRGLTYQINEDAQTLSCVGCSDTTLTGALNIPSQVVVGDKTYKVSAIEKTWGGVAILR